MEEKVVAQLIYQDQEKIGKVDFLGMAEEEEAVYVVEKKADVQGEAYSQEVVVVLQLVALVQ